VSKHEQYEELCTLAMIGEVSPAEMQDLRQHLSECPDCREQYREFTQFLLPQLSISSDNDSSFETGYSAEDRDRLRKDFLVAAEKKGRVFSEEAVRATAKIAPVLNKQSVPVSVAPMRTPYRYRWALAASIASIMFAGGYGTHVLLVERQVAANHDMPAKAKPTQEPENHQPVLDTALAQLRVKDAADKKAIAELQQQLGSTVAALQQAQHSLQESKAGQSTLEAQLTAKTGEIATLQTQAQGNQQTVHDLRGQMAQLQQRVSDSQATIAANELRVSDLNDQFSTQTASLNREREMLSVGRDVRDLMGARNLHIIDVHDANGAGKNQKSFGRIFYTEGKQLIFYAFDLDNKRVLNASYSFQAWGERLGQPSSVKSLGILYVDDKEQRRWSLKVDDPRQLSEINSVFVTLEPHGGEKEKPEGKRILFAFLGGEANHP
jgi:hypothetical protein